MDYKARFYSPYLNRFIQPDSIVPNPANPQNLNRFGYVLNNPINLIDPSGHICVNNGGTNDEVAMPGNCGGAPDSNWNGQVTPSPSGWTGHENEPIITTGTNSEGQVGGNGAVGACSSNPPYLPLYECGATVSDFAYLTPSQNLDPVIGEDTFTDFYWPGKMEENITPKSRGTNLFFLGLDMAVWAHQNTSMHGMITNQYAYAVIPFAHDRTTSFTMVEGVFVVNKTGANIAITSVSVNDQYYYYGRKALPPNAVAGYLFPMISMPQHGTVNINVNVRSSTGWGTITYSGSVYQP